jgi:hypothetical protein
MRAKSYGGAEAKGYINLISGLRVHPTHLMSLIVTIFALVFITELISWIGKSVLLHFVLFFPRAPVSPMI